MINALPTNVCSIDYQRINGWLDKPCSIDTKNRCLTKEPALNRKRIEARCNKSTLAQWIDGWPKIHYLDEYSIRGQELCAGKNSAHGPEKLYSAKEPALDEMIDAGEDSMLIQALQKSKMQRSVKALVVCPKQINLKNYTTV